MYIVGVIFDGTYRPFLIMILLRRHFQSAAGFALGTISISDPLLGYV